MRPLRSFALFLSVTVVLLLGGVVAMFLVQNDHWVLVRFPAVQADAATPFVITEWETPLSLALAVCFGLGAGITLLALVPFWVRRAVERSRDRRFIGGLEQELTDLRNLPVTDPAPLEDIDETPDPERPRARDRERGRDPDDDDEAALMASLQQSSNR